MSSRRVAGHLFRQSLNDNNKTYNDDDDDDDEEDGSLNLPPEFASSREFPNLSVITSSPEFNPPIYSTHFFFIRIP